jgi:hypothetical protein
MARLMTIGSILGFALVTGVAQANGIASFTYQGTGCPAGTVGISISNDRSTMTMIFDNFVAFTGPSVSTSEMDKNCDIYVTMQTSDSATVQVQSRGYVQLDAGTGGEEHQYIPQAKGSNTVLPFTGPTSRDYLSASVANVLAQQGCGTPPSGSGNSGNTTFRVSLSVGLNDDQNPAGSSQMTIDSLDLKISP